MPLGNPHKGQRESRLASFWPARDKGNREGAKTLFFQCLASLTTPNYVSAHFSRQTMMMADKGLKVYEICLMLIVICVFSFSITS